MKASLQVVASMFLNLDKDPGLCSYKIGFYPILKKLRDGHSNTPEVP